MNYAPLTSAPVEVRLPRTIAATPTSPRLELICTADRQTYAVPVADFSATGLYYCLRADFSGINTPGEYEYRLTAEGLLLASGIIRLGDQPNPQTDSYEIVPKYEQYNAD